MYVKKKLNIKNIIFKKLLEFFNAQKLFKLLIYLFEIKIAHIYSTIHPIFSCQIANGKLCFSYREIRNNFKFSISRRNCQFIYRNLYPISLNLR